MKYHRNCHIGAINFQLWEAACIKGIKLITVMELFLISFIIYENSSSIPGKEELRQITLHSLTPNSYVRVQNLTPTFSFGTSCSVKKLEQRESFIFYFVASVWGTIGCVINFKRWVFVQRLKFKRFGCIFATKLELFTVGWLKIRIFSWIIQKYHNILINSCKFSPNRST